MERYCTESLIWATRELGDTDLIVEFLTREHGRVSGVAKGARKSRKRFGGRLQKFVCVELRALQRRPAPALARIEEVRVKEVFAGLWDDLDRFAMAQVLLELAARVTVPGPEGEKVFDWVIDAWRRIQSGEWSAATFCAAMLSFLEGQGFLAPFHACAACGAAAPRVFVAEKGGMLCAPCGKGAALLSPALSELLVEGGGGSSEARHARCFPAEHFLELRLMLRSALQCHGLADLQSLVIWEKYLLTGDNQTIF